MMEIHARSMTRPAAVADALSPGELLERLRELLSAGLPHIEYAVIEPPPRDIWVYVRWENVYRSPPLVIAYSPWHRVTGVPVSLPGAPRAPRITLPRIPDPPPPPQLPEPPGIGSVDYVEAINSAADQWLLENIVNNPAYTVYYTPVWLALKGVAYIVGPLLNSIVDTLIKPLRDVVNELRALQHVFNEGVENWGGSVKEFTDTLNQRIAELEDSLNEAIASAIDSVSAAMQENIVRLAENINRVVLRNAPGAAASLAPVRNVSSEGAEVYARAGTRVVVLAIGV